MYGGQAAVLYQDPPGGASPSRERAGLRALPSAASANRPAITKLIDLRARRGSPRRHQGKRTQKLPLYSLHEGSPNPNK